MLVAEKDVSFDNIFGKERGLSKVQKQNTVDSFNASSKALIERWKHSEQELHPIDDETEADINDSLIQEALNLLHSNQNQSESLPELETIIFSHFYEPTLKSWKLISQMIGVHLRISHAQKELQIENSGLDTELRAMIIRGDSSVEEIRDAFFEKFLDKITSAYADIFLQQPTSYWESFSRVLSFLPTKQVYSSINRENLRFWINQGEPYAYTPFLFADVISKSNPN